MAYAQEKGLDKSEYLDHAGSVEASDSATALEQNEYQKEAAGALKLDPSGLPLIPQPSDSSSDVSQTRSWLQSQTY